MDILNTKIKNILTEKNTKIRPENIKSGVTAFGITGTYEGQQPTGTVNITQNGTVDVTNYASANVNVPTPSPNLQSKSVTITENGTQTITADSGYDGLDEIEVTTNVAGSGDLGQYALLDFTGFTSLNFTYGIKEISDLDLTGMTSCTSAFSSFGSLQKIGKLKNTSSVTTMASMFYYCRSLTELDTSTMDTFDTSNVKDINSMFYGCSGLTNLNISNFNTSKVTTMLSMFRNCTNLTTITFGNNFTATKCTSSTSMQNMFSGCTKLDNNTLNSILGICATFGGTANKTLKYIGLTEAQATTCTGLSNWATAETAGWTTGY